MNTLVWNIWGLGSDWTFSALRDILQSKRPDLVFSMETKMIASQIDQVRRSIGFGNVFSVDRVGMSGGSSVILARLD